MAYPDSYSFAAKIRRTRLAAGLSQEQLAARSGVSARAISDIERGLRKSPHPDTVRMLADGLALSGTDRETLFELARPELRSLHEGASRETEGSYRLPARGGPIIGRERELDELVSFLRGDGPRLITLTGPGGVGKTRLAIEASHLAALAFQGGAIFVDLAPINDPRNVIPAISRAIGVEESGTASLEERVGTALRDRRLLLLLDNFEHVIAAATDIATLLAGASALRVIVTSREHLRLRGEHVFVVQPLDLPPNQGSGNLGYLEANPAIALFIQAARDASPDFELTPASAPQVAAICRKLEGMPLAIELAASRVKYFSVQTLLELLDRRLPVLTGGPRDAPKRQQTLSATIAWSYDLLAPDEQALFRLLGIFSGGASFGAIEAVALAPEHPTIDVFAGLPSLVDKSLIRQAPGPDGRSRFFMLETVREFALAELMQSGGTDRAREALASWVVQFIREMAAGKESSGSLTPAELLMVDTELENIRQTFSHLSAQGDAQLYATLFTELFGYFYIRGRFREARSLANRAVELAEQYSIPDQLHGKVLCASAIFETTLGRPAEGEELGFKGLSLLKQSGAAEGLIFDALVSITVAKREQGQYAEAIVYAEEALDIALASGDRARELFAFYHIGRLAFLLGDLDRAAANLRAAVAGETPGEANETAWSSLLYLAAIHVRKGELQAAARSLREADRIREGIGGEVVGFFLNVVGAFAAEVQPTRAARIYGAITAYRDAVGAGIVDEPWITETKRDLRRRLGEATFKQEFQTGLQLGIADALDLMHDVLDWVESGKHLPDQESRSSETQPRPLATEEESRS